MGNIVSDIGISKELVCAAADDETDAQAENALVEDGDQEPFLYGAPWTGVV